MNENIQMQSEFLLSNLFLLFFLIIFVFAAINFIKKIEVRLKVRKIKKILKNKDVKNYDLVFDKKSNPKMIINKNDVSDIFIL
ncbi:hypothetical protein [Campylobacter canadensis]|uniref:hypothetical protein n=1 Tax=Campylobacter canadensis TaxID=449520 RepID=UPI001CCB70FA|nr:hypothetical protein [Campylobacter canadensis]MBZ8002378.1 hypothetical protein [Campylobacter canadensis]